MSKLHLSQIYKYGKEVEFEDINYEPIENKRKVKKIKREAQDSKRKVKV